MRRLQHLVVRRQRQALLEQLAGLRLVLVEAPLEHVDRRLFVVVARPLALVLLVHVSQGHARSPLELEDGLLALDEQAEALEPVGDLCGHELDVDAAELLEVRELRDLHAVAPDLPAEAPGAERRLLPVVLDQANVVLLEVDPERLERAEVPVEDVLGRRLEDHLVLEVVLEPERVLAVAAVGGRITGSTYAARHSSGSGRGRAGTWPDWSVPAPSSVWYGCMITAPRSAQYAFSAPIMSWKFTGEDYGSHSTR